MSGPDKAALFAASVARTLKDTRYPSVLISFDGNRESEEAGKAAARVFATKNIRVRLFRRPDGREDAMAATKELDCDLGFLFGINEDGVFYAEVFDRNGEPADAYKMAAIRSSMKDRDEQMTAFAFEYCVIRGLVLFVDPEVISAMAWKNSLRAQAQD